MVAPAGGAIGAAPGGGGGAAGGACWAGISAGTGWSGLTWSATARLAVCIRREAGRGARRPPGRARAPEWAGPPRWDEPFRPFGAAASSLTRQLFRTSRGSAKGDTAGGR
ncbi:hypothetical protein GCM10009613_53540 [Pseudonocardia kongjuensis]|uniref:Uncharacterized protein n=1 Tax=Pseudonocardia kongjuensis TaxID=102227 RepID=A0ABN1Y5Y4_9PSEU